MTRQQRAVDGAREPSQRNSEPVEGQGDEPVIATLGVPVKVARELSRLLRCTKSTQETFWVVVCHGAATERGWRTPRAQRRLEWESMLTTKYNAGRMSIALDELVEAGLLRKTYGERGEVAGHNTDVGLSIVSYLVSLVTDLKEDIRQLTPPNPRESEGNPKSIFCPPKPSSESLMIPGTENDTGVGLARMVPGIDGKPVSIRGLTRQLVELWSKRSGRAGVKVLERRVRMVRDRLREGYSAFDLAQAITGVCYSQFHREGGYDTFEVAVRNGEQVEKGKRLWLLNAPVELIEEYQRRTGESVAVRADELASFNRAKAAKSEFEDRVATAEKARNSSEQARAEEEAKDDEATRLALASVEEDD